MWLLQKEGDKKGNAPTRTTAQTTRVVCKHNFGWANSKQNWKGTETGHGLRVTSGNPGLQHLIQLRPADLRPSDKNWQEAEGGPPRGSETDQSICHSHTPTPSSGEKRPLVVFDRKEGKRTSGSKWAGEKALISSWFLKTSHCHKIKNQVGDDKQRLGWGEGTWWGSGGQQQLQGCPLVGWRETSQSPNTMNDYIESIHSSEDWAKKEIWSTNGLCGSYQNPTIPSEVLHSNSPSDEGYRKGLTRISTGKMNLLRKMLCVYIYGFLIDLG